MDEGRLGIAAALGDAAKFDHRGLEVLRARVSDGEARRDALVLLRRAARELALLGRRGPHVDDVQPAVAADERAQAQGRGARADDGSLQLPQQIAAALVAVRELLARRLLRREMHEQRLGRCSLGQPAQLERAQRVGVIDGAERKPAVGVQRLLEGRAPAGRRDHQHRHRARFTRQRAQRDQVLHQALRLRAHEAGERLGRDFSDALEACEAQPPLLDVALAQARLIGAHEQHPGIARAERGGERRSDERRGVHAGEARAGLFQRVEPLRELLGVGERGQQHALVAPLRREHRAERERRRKARVAIALGEPPREQRFAVRAAQMWNLLFVKILAGKVGEHGEERPLRAAQVFAKRVEAGLVGAELALELERRALDPIQRVLVCAEIEDQALGHG